MSQNKINVEVTDNGSLKELNSEALKLRQNIEGAAKSLPKAAAAAKGAPDTREYNTAKGIAGATGAAGRDFAKQAQGLGGLVHVYATFAANIFAVSAAFNALQKAADTSNLVKGLDQLGAASGRGLGQLSQEVVKATDGAVSLREAMTAVAQASSSGMSDKDIKRLAVGAKKASQALGVDMGDALSRLSRGITKLEPELLDELGIFVRVDRASQEYAKSVGKPVSALTDLEKRAAFANAALKQVEQKFGEINIDSNPYTQLAAQFKNVTDSGLNMVNTVLGPLIKLLGSSPTALAGVLGIITTKLVSQAIPAIGQYRNGLKQTAEQARALATSRAATASFIHKRDLDTIAANLVEKAEVQMEASLDRLKKNKAKYAKEITSILSSPEGEQIYNKQTEVSKKIVDAYDRGISAARGKQKQFLIEERTALITAQNADEAYHTKKPGRLSAAGVADISAKRAESSAIRSSAIANASENAALGGVRFAYAELNKELDASKGKISGFDRVLTVAGGTMSAVTTRIVGLGSALMAAFGWITAIIGIGATLYSVFNNNEKKSADFAASIDKASHSTKLLADVSARMSKIDPFEAMSPQNVAANITALISAQDDIRDSIDKFKATRASANTLYKVVDSASGLVGKSDSKVLYKQLTEYVSSAYTAASKDPKLQQQAIKLLSIKDKLDKQQNINEADLNFLYKGFDTEGSKAVSDSLLDIEQASKAVSSSVQTLQNTYKNTSPLRVALDNITSLAVKTLDLGNKGDVSAAEMLSLSRAMGEVGKSGVIGATGAQQLASKLADLAKDKQAAELNLTRARKNSAENNTNPILASELRAAEAAYAAADAKSKQAIKDSGVLLKATFVNSVQVLGAELDREFAKARTITATANLALYSTDSASKIKEETRIKIAEINATETAAKALDDLAIAAFSAQRALDRRDAEGRTSGVTTEFIDTIEGIVKGKGGVKEFTKLFTEGFKGKPLDDAQAKYLSGEQRALEASQRIRARGAVSAAQVGAAKQGEQISIGDLKSKTTAEDVFNVKKRELDVSKAILNAQKASGELTDSEFISRSAILEAEETAAQRKREQASYDREIEKAKQITGPNKAAERANAYNRADSFDQDTETQKKAKEIATAAAVASAKRTEELAREQNIIQFNTTQYERQLQTEEASNDLASQRLDQLSAEGSISDDLLNKEKSKLALIKAELDFQTAYIKAVNDFNAKTKKDADLVEKGGDTQVVKDAQARLDTESAGFAKTVEGLLNVKTKATEAAKNIDSMSASMKTLNNWGQKFSDTFADAIYDATESGKWDFKDMVNSMIADLGRLMLKQQMSNALADAGGTSGVAKGAWDLIKMGASYLSGGATSAGTSAGSSSTFSLDPSGTARLGQANGGAWMGGVQAFAKGGTFTNSIVSSPTLFKFAKGTGLMGEAGPEAIMPLSRDSSGKLGVSANMPASETTVVINNYSTTQATAKESLDSRGQRRVEVTIGDMVAGEIARSGSSAQQSIKSSFGRQPQLLRR